MQGKRTLRCQAVLAAAVIALLALPSLADGPKRVIYVQDDKTMSWGEGYYRQNPQPKDQFVREADGQTLRDAWKKLSSGDQFIILAHGATGGGGITAGDGMKDGFRNEDDEEGAGTGAGCGSPYALQKRDVNNITVHCVTCYGTANPGGEGQQSVTDTLEPFLGEGSSITGYEGEVLLQWRANLKKGWNPKQRQATIDCLNQAAQNADPPFDDLNAWLQSMPYGEQQNAVNAAIAACQKKNPNVWPVNIVYLAPKVEGADELGPTPDTIGQGGAAPCPVCGGADIPTVSEWGLIILSLLLLTAGTIVIRRAMVQPHLAAT